MGPSVNGKTTIYPGKMTNYLRAIDKSKVEGLYWISWEGEDMEVEIRVEPGRQERKIVILAGAES